MVLLAMVKTEGTRLYNEKIVVKLFRKDHASLLIIYTHRVSMS